jgi:proline iminopeptidase
MNHIIDNKGDKLFTIIHPAVDRETVILLHGGPGFPDDLQEVSGLLAGQFQVILFHQRGTGQSPCESNDYSMDAYVSDIDAVAAYFDLAAFHLFGHSWGGLYAQIYAQKHPGKLLSLFLCCPGSGTGPQWKQTEKEVLSYNRSKCSSAEWIIMGINSFLGMLGSDKAYKRLFRRIMINYNKDFMDTAHLKPDARNIRSSPIGKTRKKIASYPLLSVQDDPGFRITVIYGDRDIYGDSKEYVIRRYPTAGVRTIQRSGHFPWWHNPPAFKEMMQLHFH